jgi:hypothetical protein
VIERKAKSNVGGLHLLLIIMCLTPLPLFCFCSSVKTSCCSLLLCGGREQAHALMLASRFALCPAPLSRRPTRKPLSWTHPQYAWISSGKSNYASSLPHLSPAAPFGELLSRRLFPREAHRGVPGPLRTAIFSHRQRTAYSSCLETLQFIPMRAAPCGQISPPPPFQLLVNWGAL